MKMILVNMSVFGMLALVATSGCALAQSATTAEARLKEKNIVLPQGGVEGDDLDCIRVLAGEELANDGFAVGFRNVRLDESAAELPEIIDDEVNRVVVDVPKKRTTGHRELLSQETELFPQ
jgi:hypothetical protein